MKTLAAALAVCLLIPVGAASAAVRGQLDTTIEIPAELVATITATGCTSNPGPTITVNGQIVLSGLSANVILSRPGRPGAVEPVTVEQLVVPEDEVMSISTQTVQSPVGNNPYFWLQLVDESGQPLTSQIFLGRCDQAPFTPTADLVVPADVTGDTETSGCGTSSMSVDLEASAELSGINAQLIVRSTNSTSGAILATIPLVLVQEGEVFDFPQQAIVTSQGGPNPKISLQLLDGDEDPLGSEIRLGRCRALSH